MSRNATRVPATQRRRRYPGSGLFFSQSRAIRTLPPELWAAGIEAARGQKTAETLAMVRELRRQIVYGDALRLPSGVDAADLSMLPVEQRRRMLLGGNEDFEPIQIPKEPPAAAWAGKFPTCPVCRRCSRPRRADGIYCSGACRQRAYRDRRRNARVAYD